MGRTPRQEQKELTKILNIMIANRSIPVQNLVEHSKALVGHHVQTGAELAQNIIEKFDANHDGKISRDEFLEVFSLFCSFVVYRC